MIQLSRHDQEGWGLFLLRVTLGLIFTLHGAQKVLGLFGGKGLAQFVSWTSSSLGLPKLFGYLAAFAEFFGGLMLLLGIAPEIGALMVIPVMLGAVFLVHWKHGYFLQNQGFEYPLNLILLLLASIIGGPGKWALWNPFEWYRYRCLSK